MTGTTIIANLNKVHICFPHIDNFSFFFNTFLNSIHQTELVNWVSATYVETLGEIQRQSVCKGVYNALIKHFEKVENEEDVGKPQKRGSIRWRRMRNRKIITPIANITIDGDDLIAVNKTIV